MKPPDRFPPDDPREWINRARSNLAIARTLVSNAYFEDLCFDAQQALIRDYRFLHDIQYRLRVFVCDYQ